MTALAENTADLVAAGDHGIPRVAGESRSIRYVVGAVCVFVATLMLAPVVLSFFASIKTAADARATPPTYLPYSFSLENYLKVFEFQAGLWTYASNSLLVAAFTIVLCLVLAVPAGYGLARFRIWGKEVWFILLLAPLMIPPSHC
jgi:multiple sugar transport system permease protein